MVLPPYAFRLASVLARRLRVFFLIGGTSVVQFLPFRSDGIPQEKLTVNLV